MVPYEKVYDAFFAKLLDDGEWEDWTITEVYIDVRAILEGAIPNFKFPRVSLERDDDGFLSDELSNDEIQVIACFMKCEWLNRTILTWENIKPLYAERDFSQGNLLDKFIKLLETEQKNARLRERNYYRSVKGKPYSFSKLAGDPNAV